MTPSTSPDLFEQKELEKLLAKDPCADKPKIISWYETGVSAVHKDLVPRRGQCSTTIKSTIKEKVCIPLGS